MQMQIFGEIKALLAKNGIKFVPFKGAVLRELYPDPEARTMGDIDLLIEKGRQKQVKVLLCANGFENTVCGSGEWVYTKGGVITEIHTSLINGKIGNSTADEFLKMQFKRRNSTAVRAGFCRNIILNISLRTWLTISATAERA